MLRFALALCALPALAGCGILYESITETQSAMMANAWSQQIDAGRAAVTANPGAYAPAAQFASTVVAYLNASAGTPEERAALVNEAEGYLQASIKGEPTSAWAAWNDAGRVRHYHGDHPGAIEAYEASQRSKANVGALEPWFLSLEATGASVSQTCEDLRPTLGADQVVALMSSCERHGDDLAWASKADRVAYDTAKREAAEREAQRQAEAAARAQSFTTNSPSSSGGSSSSGGASSSAPSGPVMVSVTLRSSCPNTARVFFGDKPKYGSGTYSTIGSNNVQSHSMKEGDMIWLVDASDNGLASYTASSGARTVEVNSSCSGFMVR